MACGGGAGGVRQMSPAEPEPSLPAAPPGSLWADGFGPTLREASLDARRAVAEQLDARISSQLDARETEDSLRGGSRDVSQRIKTESAFEHAELIEVRGEAQRQGGYVVRAYLDKDRAAEVYRKAIADEREKLRAVEPVTRQAIAGRDAARLLRVDGSPGHHLLRLANHRRILERLDHRPASDETADEAALALEREAHQARQAVSLRLAVTGDVPEAVRAAAVEGVSKLFAGRGCVLAEAPFDPPAEGVTAANVSLRLVTRDHREAGMEWRYMGLEVEAVDARSGQGFLRFSATPDFVKGGGKGWDQADRAVVRALQEKLPGAAKTFETISCR